MTHHSNYWGTCDYLSFDRSYKILDRKLCAGMESHALVDRTFLICSPNSVAASSAASIDSLDGSILEIVGKQVKTYRSSFDSGVSPRDVNTRSKSAIETPTGLFFNE